VTVKTGTWARLTDGSMVDTNRHKTANRMEFLLNWNLLFACKNDDDCTPISPVSNV
jgi:hypothetical protein